MKKIFLMTFLSLLNGVTFAGGAAINPSALDQEVSLLKGKVQGIEGRLDQIERAIKEINIKGKFEELPLKQPNLTNDELLNWVTDAIVSIYSYNYLNAEQALNKSRQYFTDNGYDSFMKALKESKNLETVKSKKLIVNALAQSSATILKEGDVDGVYTWQIQLPLEVTYQGANNDFKQNMDIQVEVVRQTYTQTPKGIAINAVTAKLLSTTDQSKTQPTEKNPNTVSPNAKENTTKSSP